MEDLISLNKELSALIAELGGSPFSINIVDGRVVLPEELEVQRSSRNQQSSDASGDQRAIKTAVQAREIESDCSAEQKSISTKVQSSEFEPKNSKTKENISSKSSSIEENSSFGPSSNESAKPVTAKTLDSSSENRFGFVTLATTDSYASGALVLARSLRAVNTSADLVCLISSNLTAPIKKEIENAFDEVRVVDVLNSNDDAMLALLKRPELGVTLTKLHCWKLAQYSKMVFLDADTLVLQNIDDLFNRDELSAVADCGWPSCFNSGVFVFKPSLDTFTSLVDFANTQGSFDGGDQGLLNDYFSDWSTASASKILPFGYNVHAAATYAYAPAFNKFKDQVKVVHFLGAAKPWSSRNAPQEEFAQYWQRWWSFADDSSKSDANNMSQADVVEMEKSGFDIIQDALDAQMSAKNSEPTPKFDIKF